MAEADVPKLGSQARLQSPQRESWKVPWVKVSRQAGPAALGKAPGKGKGQSGTGAGEWNSKAGVATGGCGREADQGSSASLPDKSLDGIIKLKMKLSR